MAKNFRQELVGVFGYPVDENPTVVIQDAAFAEKGLFWHYLTLKVKPNDLGDAMQAVRALNFKGINLTIPHKVACMSYLDEIDKSAQMIGAVNTVKNDGGKLTGYNTDGKGFTKALCVEHVNVSEAIITLLGAGGAARAIAVETALAGASKIYIVNRSIERGQELVKLLNDCTDCQAEYMAWGDTVSIPSDTDILVNATSVGLYPDTSQPDIDMRCITSDMVVCDVIPNPADTPFLKQAKKMGAAKVISGEGMLVYQGAIGFEIWTGERAPIDVMMNAIKKAFSEE